MKQEKKTLKTIYFYRLFPFFPIPEQNIHNKQPRKKIEEENNIWVYGTENWLR